MDMDSYPLENIPLLLNEMNDFHEEEESAANFQKFIYDLFEKKGVLNNLRANLRGHIVEVLKSAQTGEPPTCQKNFTQRLELPYQATNMLITEYLLRLEFGYSLSVFVSEIPLANMVFEFAQMLRNTNDIEKIKFKENDVWSVLNYLGLKCDSHYASNILDMYNKENIPLLMCILNCSTITHHCESSLANGKSSSDSRSSSVKSFDTLERGAHSKKASKIASTHEHCRHFAFCKTCQAKMNRIRDRYRRSKRTQLIEANKVWYGNPQNVKNLMRNVGEMEKSLVDEMFQQLKGVYEAEVDLIRQNEEKTVKRSLASHVLQLQKRREEMEESFRAREAELERNVRDKKEFLWGLARALRQQHAHMTRAMHALKGETDRLTAKEDSLKSQLLEAEELLKKRGEDMRKQITDELQILEGHLESMKKERDNIERERKELEQLKSDCNNSRVVQDLSNEEIRSHYDLLKDELGILKKYLETTKLEPKCVIERSTLTEMSNVNSKLNLVLNNEQHLDNSPLKSDSEDRMRAANKVVNDLKKQKNVNFCTSNADEHRQSRSRSSTSIEGSTDRDLIARLREENEHLRTFASQQREHIDELSSEGARLRAQLVAARFPHGNRPRTAPTIMPQVTTHSLNASVSCNSVGWIKGGGEEMSVFANAQPRILLPGDTLPFVGVLRDRPTDSRRHLLNQWRSLRRTGSGKPHSRLSAKEKSPILSATPVVTESNTPNTTKTEDVPLPNGCLEYQPQISRERPKIRGSAETNEAREKSPKSVLQEVKAKLIKYNYGRSQASSSRERDKSPSSVLREAKARLRRLEIEAEAVEKSYLDFRRRQAEVKQLRDHQEASYDFKVTASSEGHELRTEPKPLVSSFKAPNESDNYRAIVNKLANFKTINQGLEKSRPIPPAYSKLETQLKESQQRHEYYLETPLYEFRKLYRPQKSPVPGRSTDKNSSSGSQTKELHNSTNYDDGSHNVPEPRIRSPRRPTSKEDELEILKENISKIYNLNRSDISYKIDPIEETIDNNKDNIDETESVEVEENVEVIDGNENNSDNNSEQPQPELLLVIESTVETKDIDISETEVQREKISTQMTIIVSPKLEELNVETECSKEENHEKIVSPEQAARLTRNDALNAIYHADPDKVYSSVETELDISKQGLEESASDPDKGGEDYPDDFSADVDNYNSRSEYEALSPVSILKNSEDDNFWDT